MTGMASQMALHVNACMRECRQCKMSRPMFPRPIPETLCGALLAISSDSCNRGADRGPVNSLPLCRATLWIPRRLEPSGEIHPERVRCAMVSNDPSAPPPHTTPERGGAAASGGAIVVRPQGAQCRSILR
eukprot:gene23374-biopygen19332